MVKTPPAIAEDMRFRFNPWVRKIPWRMTQKPIPVFLLGKSHGERTLEICIVHGVTKSWT